MRQLYWFQKNAISIFTHEHAVINGQEGGNTAFVCVDCELIINSTEKSPF